MTHVFLIAVLVIMFIILGQISVILSYFGFYTYFIYYFVQDMQEDIKFPWNSDKTF